MHILRMKISSHCTWKNRVSLGSQVPCRHTGPQSQALWGSSSCLPT
ncbi:hypothetical protein LEMLEM_LOCUS3407 [Lemmus lemmus]